MTRKILAALAFTALALVAAQAHAAPENCTNDPSLVQFADEGTGITVSSTAVGLTASIYKPDGQEPAALAICTVSTDAIMTRADGRNPTSTAGMPFTATASASVSFPICGLLNIQRFRAIRVTTDANLKCAYSRKGDK